MSGLMVRDAPLQAQREPCLVADIGGTNARFAIAGLRAGATDAPLAHAQTRRVAEFDALADAARDYLQSVPPDQQPRRAVLAVASPVVGDHIVFSNSPWSFSIAQLQSELGLESLQVVNDFAAVAWAVPALETGDLRAIGPRTTAASRNGTRVVVGPGTGLGVAAIRSEAGVPLVLESEGGHAGFAPRDDDEIYLLRFLKVRYSRVSAERLLCGEGLLGLYQAWCARNDVPLRCHRPEDVSREAVAGDPMARAATRSFCAILGSFAGDAALMFCAWNGVYLSGSMLEHVFDAEGERLFRERFEDKGRFAASMRAIPTLRIARSDVGNLGAAMYGARLLAAPPD